MAENKKIKKCPVSLQPDIENLLQEMTADDFERVLKINLTGAFNMTQAVLKPMSKARQGAIINMSSVAGRFGYPNRSAYSTIKWGLIGFTKSLSSYIPPKMLPR